MAPAGFSARPDGRTAHWNPRTTRVNQANRANRANWATHTGP
ncbi:hypothetical protein [Streptomyces sp. NPDC002690]